MGRTYSYRKCYICGKRVSAAGAAWVSHGRMHVRRGEATETRDYAGYIKFERTDKAPRYWEAQTQEKTNGSRKDPRSHNPQSPTRRR